MAMKLYARCPTRFDVFFTGWSPETESLSQLGDYVYLAQCTCCGESHPYRRDEFIAVKLPDKQLPEVQLAATP